MNVTVLYFAAVRDLVGTGEERLVLPESVRTIAALGEHLGTLHEPLHGRLGHVRFARNEEFAGGAEPLADGDTIALIPPVAGG
ncbi:MAG: Molybdenum cofactor biosynthesis protein MoaD / Molybdenum cofactor biosynthesis protein MoaE [Labilithrix sp.]|nr:Molybdenum cofactor biosynthesis protein MoaD / Molybdenum cofactor biosynthesis protein MoaE [Labilithrix sp.]